MLFPMRGQRSLVKFVTKPFQQAHFSDNGRKHFERRLVKFPASQLYDVVSDVEQYHKFVPWCKESRVIRKDGASMEAELVVGFQYLNERYTSHVTMKKPSSVIATSSHTTLFQSLKTEWKFTPARDESSTWVTFMIDFQFKSSIYNNVSDLFMNEVVEKMVQAFEKRCFEINKGKI